MAAELFDKLLKSDGSIARLQLAMLDSADSVGLTTLVPFRSIPWWLLEYSTVRHDRRGRLDGTLWEALLERPTQGV